MSGMLSGGVDPMAASTAPSSMPGGLPSGGEMLMPGGSPETGVTDPAQAQQMLDNFNYINQFAMGLGDSPDERTKNIQAISSMVASLGKTGKDITNSTLLQRMMKHRLRPIAPLPGGGEGYGQAGGAVAAAMPNTFTPDVAQAIMSRMGYK